MVISCVLLQESFEYYPHGYSAGRSLKKMHFFVMCIYLSDFLMTTEFCLQFDLHDNTTCPIQIKEIYVYISTCSIYLECYFSFQLGNLVLSCLVFWLGWCVQNILFYRML